jgi:uncharacterized coiled-coil DUF342 family protein
MRWPWVSRRAYELLETAVDELRKERNEYRDQADRAKDELINRVGFIPVSTPVREEMKQAQEEFRKLEESLQFEDTATGMISSEVLALAEDLGEKPSN